MEEGEADALWRRFTDVDAAAKRGHGIGFEEQQAFDEALQQKFPVAAGLDAPKHHITGLTSEDRSRRIDRDAARPDTTLQSTFRKATGGLESEQIHDDPAAIPGYAEMTPAERIRARVKFAAQRASRQRDTRDADRGWTRFVFNKHGALDDETLEQAPDEAAMKLGTMYAVDKRDAAEAERVIRDSGHRAIKSQQQHEAAIFGAPPSAEASLQARVDSEMHHDSRAVRKRPRHGDDADRERHRTEGRSACGSRDRGDGSRRDDSRGDRHRSHRRGDGDEKQSYRERAGQHKRRRSCSPRRDAPRVDKSGRRREGEDHARTHTRDDRRDSPRATKSRREERERRASDRDRQSGREHRRRSHSPPRYADDGRGHDNRARGRRDGAREPEESAASRQGREESIEARDLQAKSGHGTSRDGRRERSDRRNVGPEDRSDRISDSHGTEAARDGMAKVRHVDIRVPATGQRSEGTRGLSSKAEGSAAGHVTENGRDAEAMAAASSTQPSTHTIARPAASGIAGGGKRDIVAHLQHAGALQFEDLQAIDIPEGAVVELDHELLDPTDNCMHNLHADLDADVVAQLHSKKGSWRDRIKALR